MKKTTLLIILLALISNALNAQFTESFDTEIPVTWTILNEDAGIYTWDHQIQYPYAGAGHARIHWESGAHEDYLISPQFMVTTGVSDRISFYAGIDGTFWTETFEVKLSTTGTAAANFTTTIASETATTDVDGDYTHYAYDISAYNGQNVYIAIVATDTDRFYLYVDEFVNDAQPTDTADWNNLQSPLNGAINTGDTFTVYAQIFEDGITNPAGQGAGVESWIGYSSSDTDPSGGGWTWISASYNADVGNNDEYQAEIGSGLAAGTYYYASRFRLNGGPYTYGGSGGFWNNDSGDLTVTDPPAPANDDCSNATILTGLPYNEVLNATSATNNSGFITDCGIGMNDGVWYTFTTVVGGTVDIVVSAVTGWDPELAIYSGSCGAFVCVDSADAGFSGDGETLSAVAVAATTQYWINVGQFSSSTDNPEGPFTIDISTSDTTTTLAVEEAVFEGFKYYPNPVTNTLSLKAQQHIQNVTVYNMLGQEVLRISPNNIESEINMTNLQTGAYFVKVTVNELTETIRIIKE